MRLGGHDPVADRERRDVVADGLDGAAHLGADDERQRPAGTAPTGSRCR